MDVVVVESPAKAKTINKYLGSDYKVLASVGHVRDLVSKDGSVQPDDNFRMVWTVDPRAEKNIQAIQDAIQGAEHLYLTDPDREARRSWHVQEILNEREALDGIDVKRVVFHEVTKNAVIEALANPRELNQELIDAYLARRALDYLVGFSLSPVLWRKLPGSRSAGRVQSVALRLICEREAEIEVFKPQEYWTIGAEYDHRRRSSAASHLNGEKLERYDIANEGGQGHRRGDRAPRLQGQIGRAKTVVAVRLPHSPHRPCSGKPRANSASRRPGPCAPRRNLRGCRYRGRDRRADTYMRTDS